MPKVTLLADEWTNYSMAFGKGMFDFNGGSPKEVPVAVALEVRKRKNSEGRPMFLVEELPDIVEVRESVQKAQPVQQNGAISKKAKARRPSLPQRSLFPTGA